MATIMNDAAYMALPMNIKRGNPIPLDTTAVWYNKTELETYAASGATAYVGQVLTLIADGKAEAYMISNEAGTLVKLAQTTATGDLASDVTALQGKVADLISKVGVAKEGETPASGLYALIDEVKTLAEGKVASVTAGDNSITIGGTDATAPTVAVKVSTAEGNALSLADDGLKVEIPEVKVPVYSLVKDETAATGDIATYHLTKDGKNEGVAINVPKDLVVSSGSVVELEDGALPEGVTVAGTYIKLILANSDKPIYINVGSLIEYVTGGSGENDAIQINVSSDTHKVTASVKAGSLTKTMLDSGVQGSLDKADSAVQTIVTGEANGTIKVDDTEVAVAGLQDAAFATVESINTTAQGYVNTAKTALEGTATDTDESVTIAGAKKYADKVAAAAGTNASTAFTTEIGKLKNDDAAVANQFVTAVKEANGIVTVERKALVAADIPELAQSKISGLDTALTGKQNNLTFDGDYEAGVNNAATVSTVTSAKTALIGDTSADATTTDGNTIADVRRYVDAKTKNIASDKALEGLTTRVTTAEGEIDDLQAAIGTNGSVTKAIADAKKAGTDAATAVTTLENGKVKDNADAIAAINNAETGILKQAKDYADGKDAAITAAQTAADNAAAAVTTLENGQVKTNKTDIAAINTKIGTVTEGKTIVDMISDAKKAGTDAMTKIGTIPEGATATTAIGYIDEKIAAIPAQVDYTVTCDATTPEGVAKRYVLSQKGSAIATIDIPKDMVVSSGTVETKAEAGAWGEAGTYLVLTLANANNDKVYINASDLIEYVTGAAAADGIITTSVDANHVLTATIGDGTITKTKLTTAVQTSLGKADTALQAAALEPYAKSADVESIYVKKNGTDRLMTVAEGTKLAGVAEGAQVNVIESVKVNGVAQTVTEKAVDIAVPVADGTSIALTENKLSVKAVSTDLLTQGTLELILDGGHA